MQQIRISGQNNKTLFSGRLHLCELKMVRLTRQIWHTLYLSLIRMIWDFEALGIDHYEQQIA